MDDFFIQSEIFEGAFQDKFVLYIKMANNEALRKKLKELCPKARWLPSYKLWFVSDTLTNRKLLNLPSKKYNASHLLNKIDPVNHSQMNRYFETLRLKGYSEHTIRTYCTEFAQWLYYLKNYSILNTTPEDLRVYIFQCITNDNMSENQVHSRLNALKFYYEKLLKYETFFFEIPRPKKKSNLPKVLSTNEIKKLFDSANNLKELMILKIGYGLGLRVSEIGELKIKNIDSDRMLVHIQCAKGKKDRYVPLPHSILEELRLYYKSYRPSIFLFENRFNEKLSTRSIQIIFKKAKDKAGISKVVGIHGLRHSYATHLLEYGTDMSIIQKLLGHNNIKTTEVYAKVSNTFLSKITSPLDFLNKNEPK